MNAFWWIAGDCLGFRRGTAESTASSSSSKKQKRQQQQQQRAPQLYKFASELRYDADRIMEYPQQLTTLLQSGFALWDVVASCEKRRPNSSLDQDITQAQPNAIYEFCRQHPSIQRIVLANGGSGSKEFMQHFRDWMASGQLVVNENDAASQKMYGPLLQRLQKKKQAAIAKDNKLEWTSDRTIALVSAISVSPAAARHSYAEKRDFWDEFVYRPGLELLEQQQQQQQNQDDDDDDNSKSKYFKK